MEPESQNQNPATENDYRRQLNADRRQDRDGSDSPEGQIAARYAGGAKTPVSSLAGIAGGVSGQEAPKKSSIELAPTPKIPGTSAAPLKPKAPPSSGQDTISGISDMAMLSADEVKRQSSDRIKKQQQTDPKLRSKMEQRSFNYARRQSSEKLSQTDRELIELIRNAAGEIITTRSKTAAIRESIRIAQKLRRDVDNSKFDGFSFFFILGCSIMKDFLDSGNMLLVGMLELTGIPWIINFCFGLGLFIFFLGRGSFLKRLAIKWLIWPYVIEFIPYINFFPTWTLMTILLKLKVNKVIKEKEEQLKKISEITDKATKKRSSRKNLRRF